MLNRNWTSCWRAGFFCSALVAIFATEASAEPLTPPPVTTGSFAEIEFQLLAQWPTYPVNDDDPHYLQRGPGGYLSWMKILSLVIVFFVWLRLADWMNRDCREMHEQTRLQGELFNPINLVLFFVGFLIAISVPFFFVGFPLFLIAAFLPFFIYLFQRNARVAPQDKAFTPSWIGRAMKGEVYAAGPVELPQDVGPQIEFSAAGNDAEDSTANLIRARRSDQFIAIKDLLHNSIEKRASNILMEYTRDAVQVRMEVDGFWHNVATLDRPTGDSMLIGLKSLAGLNANERRAKQVGRFVAEIKANKTHCELMSQGVPTGERVIVKISQAATSDLRLSQLGMWPEMVEKSIECMNSPGIVVVSAPPGGGFSTTWKSMLTASDRVSRDSVALIEKTETETAIENIQRRQIIENGQGDVTELGSLLLRNPDAYVVPEIPGNPQFIDRLIKEVTLHERSMITKVAARSAAEAILKVMQKVGDRKAFIQALTFATGQRLARRLCDSCKQPLQANPKLLQQLGATAGDEVNLCGPYKLPPVEQRVDEHGQPIEMQECQLCGGLGYIGRIAIIESIVIDEEIRKVLTQSPRLDILAKAVQQRGNKTQLQQGYRLALAGLTSVQEIQRVFQPKKK